jgi:hypothetical protein
MTSFTILKNEFLKLKVLKCVKKDVLPLKEVVNCFVYFQRKRFSDFMLSQLKLLFIWKK